jgi:type IV secretion system protein VirB9
MTEKQAPAPGKDGRVLYTFGAGLPTIVCAPMRVCVLELEAGEKVIGEPHIGDSVRWSIAPAGSGTPDMLTSMIVIKPKQSGLDTNLLVTTDRRAYYIRLVSKPEEYLARVAFSYPEDDASKWKAHFVQQEQRRKQELENSRIESIESMENLYFDYRITGRDENIRPVRVVDDGKKTFIQMPSGTAAREVPVLVVLGPEGKAEMVNYRVKSDLYIVDRLFERGALLLGAGKKQHRADIIRGTYHRRNAKAETAAFSRPIDEVRGADKN